MINFSELLVKHISTSIDKDVWGEGDTDETYHPSYIGYCPRQFVLTKSRIIKPSQTLKGIFYLGKWGHVLMQSLVEDVCEIEKKIRIDIPDSNLYITGSIDAIDKDNIVYDFKTKSTIKYMTSNVKDEHKIQAMTYMYAIKGKRGSIIYIDKTTLATKQIAFNYNENIMTRVFAKIKKIHPKYLEWKATGFDLTKIPYPKCKCMMCRYEKLPEVEK